MAPNDTWLVGYETITLDDRRIRLPKQISKVLLGEPQAEVRMVVVEERPRVASLWSEPAWNKNVRDSLINEAAVGTQLGRNRSFGRFLSERTHLVNLKKDGRVQLPDSVRDYLDLGEERKCVVIGAGVCVEVYHPDAWRESREQRDFETLFEGIVSTKILPVDLNG